VSVDLNEQEQEGGQGDGYEPRHPADRAAAKNERRHRIVSWAQQSGVFFALMALALLFSLMSDRFFLRGNLTIVALQISVIGIVAIPGAMLVLSGYVDLSVGSVMILSAVGFGQMFDAGVPIGLAVAVGLAIGLVWGLLVNGYLIAYLGFSPIVVTLGGLALARGLAEAWSQGITVFGFGDNFGFFGTGRWLDMPIPVWIFLVVVVAGFYAWNVGPWGRRMMAIGSSPEAALSLGVRIKRIPFLLYGASGLAAAVGGLILTAQLDAATLSIGRGLELQVLTAILLGGVSFTGGRGTLGGVLSGLAFLGVLRNGLILIGVGVFWQQAAVGSALLFAAFLDALYRRLERVAVEGRADEPEVPKEHTNAGDSAK